MRLRVDVGIDAQRDTSDAVQAARQLRDAIELACRLCVDGADALDDGHLELIARLAHTGEDDVLWIEPGA